MEGKVEEWQGARYLSSNFAFQKNLIFDWGQQHFFRYSHGGWLLPNFFQIFIVKGSLAINGSKNMVYKLSGLRTVVC
jgi:hypothetical protein